ncbi:MAG: PHP domain-containing protein [Actinobacteria bacterium]|nr:PHP domain-containing protein [Actinomycetota bacterium]MCL5445552.1 PHP domain-containing protein [Actinomycetota bacterium]
MIDLHTHSRKSDGTDPPSRIAELAKLAQCSAFALSDHDTLEGVEEAGRRAGELGVELVPACEVSCSFESTSAHVLVYFVGAGEGPFESELVRLREDRIARNHEMAARLADLGLPVSYEEVVAEATSEESVGRPHFAGVLVSKGAAESIEDAFDRWLARGRPGYVPKDRLTPVEVARLARLSGGVAVLAHPLSLGLSRGALSSAIGELAAAGFTGVEAVYGSYTPEERAALSELAREHDLVATGGSDYHGEVKPNLAVGTGRGDLKVQDAVLDQLKSRVPR